MLCTVLWRAEVAVGNWFGQCKYVPSHSSWQIPRYSYVVFVCLLTFFLFSQKGKRCFCLLAVWRIRAECFFGGGKPLFFYTYLLFVTYALFPQSLLRQIEVAKMFSPDSNGREARSGMFFSLTLAASPKERRFLQFSFRFLRQLLLLVPFCSCLAIEFLEKASNVIPDRR